MRCPVLLRAGLASLAIALTAGALGQSSIPGDARLHAVTDARVEIGDGRVLERATVVMRNGTIVAIGPDVPIPAGAAIFDGKGTTVYPGFIDAWTDRGTNPPAISPDQDAAPSAADYASAFMREADRKGIRPELEARNVLALGDDVTKPYRNAGFTTLMIVPKGNTVSGVGTLVDLSGRPARECVVIPRTALAVNFDVSGTGNAYPGSLLGRIALFRQTLADVRWQQAVTAASLAGGTDRPVSDPVLESLVPAVGGVLPVAFEADTPAQIDRALLISKEYGLKPAIVGGLQAYKRIPQIKAAGTPLIVGLNFGVEPTKPVVPPVQTGDDPGDDTPPDPLETYEERMRGYNEAARNASLLQAAGVPFALSTHGSKDVNEFMRNLRAAVKNGLPRDLALRALTRDAANVLGVGRQLGTLEVGKVANVVVMSGDFLDEKTKVKMVYADGWRIDPEAKTVPPTVRATPIKDEEER